jgi:hypothetical protein
MNNEKDFKKFIDDNNDDGDDDNQGVPIYLILCVKEKSKSILEAYSTSIDFLMKLMNSKDSDKSDLIINDLKNYIKRLQEEYINVLNQFNNIMIGIEPYEEDDSEEGII